MASRGSISFIELAVLGWSVTAQAAGPTTPIRLELRAAADCATEAQLLRAMRGRSGRLRLAEAGESAVTVRVTLSQNGGRVQGELSLEHEDGTATTRTVGGSSCDSVVNALSLTAALALDPAAEESAPGSTSRAGDVSTSPAAGGAGAQAMKPGARPERANAKGNANGDTKGNANGDTNGNANGDTKGNANGNAKGDTKGGEQGGGRAGSGAFRLKVEAGVQATLVQVIAPHVNVGGALTGRVRLERESAWSPSLGVSLWHVRNELFQSSERAAIHLSAVTLSACPLRLGQGSALRLEPCAVLGAGRLDATGKAIEAPRAVTRAWWAVGGWLRGGAQLGAGLSLELEAGLLVPLVRRRFITTPGEIDVGESAVVSPLANLGIVYAF